MKLYELSNELLAIAQHIAEWRAENETETGCPSDLHQRLNELRCEDSEKLHGCWCHIKNLDAEIECLHNEERKLKRRREILENELESFKAYIAHELKGAPFKHRQAHFAFRQNPPSVDPNIDFALLPEQYRRVELVPLKKEILADLKAGAEIPGCRLQSGKLSLIVK